MSATPMSNPTSLLHAGRDRVFEYIKDSFSSVETTGRTGATGDWLSRVG